MIAYPEIRSPSLKGGVAMAAKEQNRQHIDSLFLSYCMFVLLVWRIPQSPFPGWRRGREASFAPLARIR